MRWSQLSLRWQLLELVLFFGAMSVISYVVQLFFHAIPIEAVELLDTGFVGIGIGMWIGQRATTQLLIYGNPEWPIVRVKETPPPIDPVREEFEARRFKRTMIGLGIIAAVSLPIMAALLIVNR